MPRRSAGSASGDGWISTDFGEYAPDRPDAPVCHVNWFEADAYARAHGARLPTEFEWEVAASYDPRAGAAGDRRTLRLGRQRLDPGRGQPRPTRVRRASRSAAPTTASRRSTCSARSGSGRVSEFSAYPGFEPFCLRASTPSRSSTTATGCCVEDRGRPAPAPSTTASATGTCPQRGRSSPASDSRGAHA